MKLQKILSLLVTQILIFLTLIVIGQRPAIAAVKIVTTVNGSVITNYQIDQRSTFLEMITNVGNKAGDRNQIKRDAQQMLIDEILKIDEAKKIDPNIAEKLIKTAQKLVNENFATKQKGGRAVLKERGIEPTNIENKFIADIAWAEFIKYKFKEQFQNLEASVNAALNRAEKTAKQPHIKLSEIILVPTPERPFKATLAVATEIVKAVRRGANFYNIAQQYSASGTSGNGGRLGWVARDQLPPKLLNTLDDTRIGEVSEAIEHDGLVIIMLKEGIRDNGIADPGQDVITLARAVIPLAKGSTNADQLEAAARLERASAQLNSCDDVSKLHKNFGSNVESLIQNILLGSLSKRLREKIEPLGVTDFTEPLAFTDGVSILMLCARDKPKISVPSREEIRQSEFDKVFGDLSERYLIRLRRAAVIETK